MADATKILGQNSPSTSDAAVYTTPAVTKTIAKLFVCNTGATAATFRVGLDSAGDSSTVATTEAIYYDESVGPSETIEIGGLALQAASKVWTRASVAAVTFTLTGIESTGY